MNIVRIYGAAIAMIGGTALATPPPYTTLNVMLQFTCLSLAPPMYTGETIGNLDPPPIVRTERTIGGRQASHRIMLGQNRFIQIEERLVPTEECARAPQNEITWTALPRGGRVSEFCITANVSIDSNVLVRLTLPSLESDYERRVVEAFQLISACRIERGPFDLFPGSRLVVGRQLWVPHLN